MEKHDHEFIHRVETWQTGGNVMVDVVYLDDGTVIGISDDCIILYDNAEAFWETEVWETEVFRFDRIIFRPVDKEVPND